MPMPTIPVLAANPSSGESGLDAEEPTIRPHVNGRGNEILKIRTGKMCSTEVAAIECPSILFDDGKAIRRRRFEGRIRNALTFLFK